MSKNTNSKKSVKLGHDATKQANFSKSLGAKSDMGGVHITRVRPAGSNKTRATNRQKKRRRK